MGLTDTIRFIVNHPLSDGRRLTNLSRFAKWQVQSRLFGKQTTFTFVNGTRMNIERGMTGVSGNLYVGLDEFEDMAVLLHVLRPGDVFVDVGANVGTYTILAAGAVGATVVAFEPGPQARDWLRLNVNLNTCGDRVDVRGEAVGAECGVAGFTTDLDTTNHLVVHASQAERGVRLTRVPLTTLDAALTGKHPRMIKIDVEGFEADVVKGSVSTLADPELKCVLLELAGSGTRYGFDEDEIRRHMSACGFGIYQYKPFERALIPRKGPNGNNTLFVRDLDFVQARLVAAPPFRVLNLEI